MVFTFDTLGYAQRLRQAAVPAEQAEAHAEAARDFIMAELVTKADLQQAIARVNERIDALDVRLSERIDALDARLSERINALDARLSERINALDARLSERIDRIDTHLNERIDRINDRFERQTLQLTVRLGVMLAAAIAVFSTVLGVLGRLG